jgi:hypothetical protein
MTDPTVYADIAERKDELIRKALQGSVFIAPSTADGITALTTGAAAGLNALPEGYTDVGMLTTDGTALSEGITSSDIASWGFADPTRSDITKRTSTAKFTMQETNLRSIGLYTGADTAGILADATTGEVQIAQPSIPTKRYYRTLILAVDTSDDGEIYIARFWPRASVTDLDDQSYANGDDPVEWGVTLTAYPDSDLGFATQYLFGGPGWKALLTNMGIDDES